MKVLITPRSFGQSDAHAFRILEQAGLEIVKNDTGKILSEEMLADLIKDCDGIILGVDPLTAKVLDGAPKLRAIAKYGVGVDNIDLDACKKRNIHVSRTVGANANAVADYAFALMLSVSRQIIPIDKKCRAGAWEKSTSLDVYGKTLGLVGLGAIGKGVAARARGFDMRVFAYDPFWDEAYAAEAGIQRASLDEIYQKADFISVHVPLNEETRGLIGARELGLMKPTAILINTARGGVIDEDALIEALQSGQIYGAGLDVFEKEPPSDTRWFALSNVVLGSHCAASTLGATEQMSRMAAENLVRDLNLT